MALKEKKKLGWKHGRGGGQKNLPGQRGVFLFFHCVRVRVCGKLGMNSLRPWMNGDGTFLSSFKNPLM